VRYDDAKGDENASVTAAIAAAEKKTFHDLKAAHVADYRRCLCASRSTWVRPIFRTADKRANTDPIDRQRSGARGAVLPVRPLSADLIFAHWRPAPRCRPLERQPDPPWESKFTININTEMNYWLAGPGT